MGGDQFAIVIEPRCALPGNQVASGDDAAKKYTQEYTGIKCFKCMAHKAHREDSHV